MTRSYTPAQRRALLALTGEWSHPGRRVSEACHSLTAAHRDLCESDLWYDCKWIWQWRLTPAGLSEQTRLREETGR